MYCPSTTSARWPSASRVSSRIVSTLALLTLCACSSVPPKEQPPLSIKEPPRPVLPRPEPVKTEQVRWQVVDVGGEPMFALTARGYEALSRNMAEMIRWAKEASWQLDFYRADRLTDDKEAAK